MFGDGNVQYRDRFPRGISEIVILIYSSLNELGHEVLIRPNVIDCSLTNILFGAHLIDPTQLPELPEDTIIVNTEQLGGSHQQWTGIISLLAQRYQVWDYSSHNVTYLSSRVPVRAHTVLRLGYHENLERFRRAASPCTDLVFLGSMTKIRQEVLNDLYACGIPVKCYWGLYRWKRDQILAYAGGVLNIHSQQSRILEWTRILYCVANRVPCMSSFHPDSIWDGDQDSFVLRFDETAPGATLAPLISDASQLVKSAEASYERLIQRPQVCYTEYALDMLLSGCHYGSSKSTVDETVVPSSSRVLHDMHDIDVDWYQRHYAFAEADPRSLANYHLEVGVERQYHPNPMSLLSFKPPIDISLATIEDVESRQNDKDVNGTGMRTAVCLHFFSVNRIFDFFSRYASSFSRGTDFFLTVHREDHKTVCEYNLKRFGYQAKRIDVISNRGRDIPSKYIRFVDDIQTYDLCLFSHGKESDLSWFLHQNDLLCRSPKRVAAIECLFSSDSSLGLVMGDYPEYLKPYVGWAQTRPIIDRLLEPFGCHTRSITLLEFPVGGFFWARPSALTVLHSLGITEEDCPEEPLPMNDTILHALERMPCISCEMMGLRWEKVQ
jgi:hypothetical protein